MASFDKGQNLVAAPYRYPRTNFSRLREVSVFYPTPKGAAVNGEKLKYLLFAQVRLSRRGVFHLRSYAFETAWSVTLFYTGQYLPCRKMLFIPSVIPFDRSLGNILSFSYFGNAESLAPFISIFPL